MDEPFPGGAEIHLRLAGGAVATLFDKPPVLDRDDRLGPDSAYPVALLLACAIVPAEVAGQAIPGTLRVTLAHGVSDQSGVSTFCVREQDVITTAD